MVNGASTTQQVQCSCYGGVQLGQATINILSDDALLYVFDFFVAQASGVETWHTLVHVCRRWRNIVLGSPRRLNLRITCRSLQPLRKKLDVWPALPIAISDNVCPMHWGLDNLQFALERNERVSQIDLPIMRPWVSTLVFGALEKPFPALTDLTLLVKGYSDPFYPNPVKFFGGFTRLQSLSLTFFGITGLSKIFQSFTDLHLNHIPITDFILPDAIVTALSTLTRLKVLRLELIFDDFDQSRPDLKNRSLPPPTRAVLPSLTVLELKSVDEYLEDFMARIDQLDHLDITSNSPYQVIFDNLQLLQHISRIPKLQVPVKAHIGFDGPKVWIEFSSPTQASSNVLTLGILRSSQRLHLPCLAQFCRSPLFPLPTLEDLYINQGYFRPSHSDYYINITQWIELFQPFTSVKNLYLAEDYNSVLLKVVGGRAAEVLPMLENVFLEKFRPFELAYTGMQKFLAARELTSRPVVISCWDSHAS